MTIKKMLSIVLAVCISVTAFVGCSSQSPVQSDGSSNTGNSSDIVKVGYIGSLTGDGALWGQAGLNGLLLAADEINAAGGILGKQVEIVQMDNRMQAVDSVNALKKLASDSAVCAVIGTTYSSCNVPMSPVADELKIPVIATTAANPKVTVNESGEVHSYSFRLCVISTFQGAALANYAKNELGANNAAVITDSSDEYSSGLSDAFVATFQELGGTVVASELGQAADTDYRSQLSKIAAANPDVLFVPWVNKNVALITKQARELGITCDMIGGDGWDSPEVITLAGEDVLEGSHFTSQSSVMRPSCAKFSEAYEAIYKEKCETEALFGYDGLYLIADAAARADSIERDALRDAIEQTKDLAGLTGTMSVDPATHNPQKSIALNVIKNGAVEYQGDIAA